MMYHGTTADITAIDRDICLTDDREIAESYLDGAAGYVYEVALADAPLADEDDIRDAAQAEAQEQPRGDVALMLSCGGWVYELIDAAQVRDELTSRGYVGARYADANRDNATEHDTIRIWATGVAQIITRKEI